MNQYILLVFCAICLQIQCSDENENSTLTNEESVESNETSSLENKFLSQNQITNLTANNFDEFISTHERVLVVFYVPWCRHSKDFQNAMSKAIPSLQSKGLRTHFAAVDSIKEIDLASKYHVLAYPTVKFFVQGKPIDYSGGKSSINILSWIELRDSNITRMITELKTMRSYMNTKDKYMIFFGDIESNEYMEYVRVCMQVDLIDCFHTNDDSLRNFFSLAKNITCVVFYRPFDDEIAIFYDDINESNKLLNFVNEKQFSLVMMYDAVSLEKIFSSYLETLFVIGKENSRAMKIAIANLKSAAETLKGKIELCYVYSASSYGSVLASYLGVTIKDEPQAMIVIPDERDVKKFVPESFPSNPTDFIQFYNDFRAGKLRMFLKSEPIPVLQNESAIIVKLVGQTFRSIVFDENTNVIVFFEIDDCRECTNMFPEFESAATQLANSNNIIFGRINAMHNDIEKPVITKFPTILIFPKNNKDTPYEYKNVVLHQSLIIFINKVLIEAAEPIMKIDLQ